MAVEIFHQWPSVEWCVLHTSAGSLAQTLGICCTVSVVILTAPALGIRQTQASGLHRCVLFHLGLVIVVAPVLKFTMRLSCYLAELLA